MQLGSISRVTAVGSEDTASASAAFQRAADSSSLSSPVRLFKKLEVLSKTPAKLEKALKEISQKLQQTARDATDPREQEMLGNLATRFAFGAPPADASTLSPAAEPPPPPADGERSAHIISARDQTVIDARQFEAAQGRTAARAYQRTQSAALDDKTHALFSSLSQIADAAG